MIPRETQQVWEAARRSQKAERAAPASVQPHAKDAAEESFAVVLLLDAPIGNMPYVGRHFVTALLAEGEPDAEVLVELEPSRELTFLVEPGVGYAADAKARLGKDGRRSDRRADPAQRGSYASLPERPEIAGTLGATPIGDLGINAHVEAALGQRRAGAYRVPVCRKAVEGGLISAGHGDPESGRGAKAVRGGVRARRAYHRCHQHY